MVSTSVLYSSGAVCVLALLPLLVVDSIEAAPAVSPQKALKQMPMYPAKRSFDALASSGFSGFDKRAFDSFTGPGFTGLDRKRSFDSLTGMGFTGLDKRGFDSLTGSGFTGFDKRAFDSLADVGFTGFD
uniref:Orcokinin n=1 Tax=Steinernema glaseri TaxID=37863 RepID=A0A1I7Z620_9BILA